MDLSTITAALTALLVPTWAISWIVSHYLDTLPDGSWWKRLTAPEKFGGILVTNVIVGLAAYFGLQELHTLPGPLLDQANQLYAVIYAIIISVIAAQLQHNSFTARILRMRLEEAQIRTITIQASSVTSSSAFTTGYYRPATTAQLNEAAAEHVPGTHHG